MKHITSTNLANWAPKRDCQENFPLLIRRLIRSSPVQIVKMLFPAGDNVILPGFDGTLQVNECSLYIPAGESKWEIGTGRDYKDKFNQDYTKRTGNLSSDVRSELSFVFATPYVWADKEQLLNKKREEHAWKDIVIIDGQVLEEWIDSLPPVSSWLAKFLNLPQGYTLPLDQFWKEWTTNQTYTLPVSLITYGRDVEANKIFDFLVAPPGSLLLKANTAIEALAFVAATIERMEHEIKETLFAKAVIVENEQIFRELAVSKSSMILVVGFDNDTLLDLAVKNGHHVIFPIGNELTAASSVDLELPRIHRTGFEKGLEEMGLDWKEAERLIKDSGLSLTVLRRLLKFDKNKQPAWARDGSQTDIIPALLAGR
ncbi:MAG: hypothetical protein WKF97_20735 [Chitinophagaceae bacterium]